MLNPFHYGQAKRIFPIVIICYLTLEEIFENIWDKYIVTEIYILIYEVEI
jgi:hypothetical protein